VLYEGAESVELGAWAQTVPPSHRDASHVDGNPVDGNRPDDAREPKKPDALDAAVSEQDCTNDTLPELAWQLKHDQFTTNRRDPPAVAPHDTATAASNPYTLRQHHRRPVRYHISYECSVCGEVRELETPLRVCAFVDECMSCGTVARFTAVGIPTPVSNS
jgi:hypothetical protein